MAVRVDAELAVAARRTEFALAETGADCGAADAADGTAHRATAVSATAAHPTQVAFAKLRNVLTSEFPYVDGCEDTGLLGLQP